MKGKHVKSENVIQRIICLALIVVMLTSNLIMPATIIAKEISSVSAESSEQLDNEDANETENASTSNSTETSSNESKQSEGSSTGESGTTSVSNEGESANGGTGGSSEGTENLPSSTSQSNSGAGNSNNASIESSGSSVSNSNSSSMENSLSTPASSSNVLNASQGLLNSGATTLTAQGTTAEEQDKIKPITKEDIENLKNENKYKTKNNKNEIEIFNIQFVEGATENSNGDLVWTANSAASGHQFVFRVNYQTSGYGDLEPEAIKITIPKQILRDKEGNLADTYYIALPSLEEYEQEGSTSRFVYVENKDYIVIYNPAKTSAAIEGHFELYYATNKTTFNYKDYDEGNKGLIADGETASDPFYATMKMELEDDTLYNITSEKSVYIDTNAEISSTQKRYPTLYRTWNTSWQENKPGDADEYNYLVWEIVTNVSNPTQKYNFTLEDVIADLTEDIETRGYELVGYKLSGETYYSNKNTQTGLSKDGYRYDYVLTRHKKSIYDEITYKLQNTVTAKVIPVDGVDNTTTDTSSNTFSWDRTPNILTSTTKKYPTLYRTWNSSWKEEVPGDSDEYYYLVWEVVSYVQKESASKYDFTLEDVIGDSEDYELVGYKLSGEEYYSDKNTQTNITASGYRYDYVLTRHKKSTYYGISYSLENTVTATLHPKNGIDSDTVKTSSNTYSYVRTPTKITSTSKKYPTLYRTWNSSWKEEAPEDSDKYYYLVWNVVSYIQKDPEDKYDFTLTDVVSNYSGNDDYELVGYKLSGEKYYSDKNTQTNLTASGYRYDYVLTRHKISTYEGIAHSLRNTVTATVKPLNKTDNETKATSSNTYSWAPPTIIVIPTKISSITKRYPTIYQNYNTSWQEEKPGDADDYYYLVWEIESYIQKDSDEKYDFKLDDVIGDSQDYELVGYKLSGEKYYSDKNIQTDLTTSGYRYDYVLTRHKKSTYENIAYSLNNTVTATVTPKNSIYSTTTATASNTFVWNRVFTAPIASFSLSKYGNNNWYSRFKSYWDYVSYELDKLQYGEVDELKGFKYYTETTGYAYRYTLDDDGSLSNPGDYGQTYVTYDTQDDTLYLQDDTTPMTYEDYYLDYLTYSVSVRDVEYDNFYNTFKTTTTEYEDTEEIIFYGKFDGEDKWEEVGRYNLKTKDTTINEEYVKEMTTSKITFKTNKHCTGWRFLASNKHYYTYVQVTPYFVLTNSAYVMEKIADQDYIKVKNNISTKITDYKNNTIFEREMSAIDYARVAYYTSQIKKTVSSVSNSRAKGMYTITWKVNAWEKVSYETTQAEYVWQDSGIFYDLIPAGGTVNLNSLQVKSESRFLEENEYTSEVIENYNNSGRDLLIVKIKEQAKEYTLYYNTNHTWDSIKDYGKNILNPVAYETGNAKIGNGYADNGGNLSTENKELFTDLDKTTDAKKFIYAEANYSINILTAASSGLDKKVKTSKDADYSYNTEVEPEGSYSYRLRFQNTYMNKAKDLVFYDSLENFEVVDSKAGTKQTSSWKGTLKHIDLSQLEEKGIDAVCYISTIENLNLEENNDITDTSIWKVATSQTDLSTATAVAIDARKTTEGEDFVLDAGDSITAVLYMQAPNDATKEMIENPYTYNNVYMSSTLVNMFNGEEEYFIHQDYTTVKYHLIADVPFYKVNSQDETEGIKGITFRLYGTSRYGTEVDMYVTSAKNGYTVFKDVELGEYILQEYECGEDWLEDHTEHIVEIREDRTVYIDGVQDKTIYSSTGPALNGDSLDQSTSGQNSSNPNNILIKNTPRAHTNVIFYKKDLTDKNKALEGVKFKLEGTSDYGSEVLMYRASNKDGKITFENVEKGKYELTEVATIEGYVLSGITYEVIVDENSNYEVTGTNCEYTTSGTYNIYNEPYHSFYFVKKDNYNDAKIGGAEFRLYGVSNTGNLYDETVTSVEKTGFVTFENLESGTYVIKELQTPDNDNATYVLDNVSHAVEVFEDGKVTLDDNTIWPLSEINDEPYTWYNTRNKGQITITKKWVDNSDNDTREEPVIYISTEKPDKSSSLAYFKEGTNSKSIIDYVTTSNTITAFKRDTKLSEDKVNEIEGVQRLDNGNDANKIYGWVIGETFYWWTKADKAVLPVNLQYYFYNESGLKDISWAGIYTSGYWKGSAGSEKIVDSITNMQYMFYGCSGIERLNIEWFNNTAITANTSMTYAFGNNYSSTVAGTMDSLKYITIGENFKLFNTSVLTKGSWKNQGTGKSTANTALINTIPEGTYEYVGYVVKYAVQIYGINQDVGADGNPLGLTFGPATGRNSQNGNYAGNYNNAYVTHTYELVQGSTDTYNVVIQTHDVSTGITTSSLLTDSSGNVVTRTTEEMAKYNINIHDMSWSAISAQSQADPTVFTDCMLCGDTKSVEIHLNSKLAGNVNQAANGDGAGILYSSINSTYRKWNNSNSNGKTLGGYATSRIRATLLGNEIAETSIAGTDLLDSSSSLYSCLEGDLQSVIKKKNVKYATGSSGTVLGSTTTYGAINDSIWLFSYAEMCMSASSPYSSEGAINGVNGGIAYQKFNDTRSSSFVSTSANSGSTNARVAYNDSGAGSAGWWWLRSPYFGNTSYVYYVYGIGGSSYYGANNTGNGLAFGFCI